MRLTGQRKVATCFTGETQRALSDPGEQSSSERHFAHHRIILGKLLFMQITNDADGTVSGL